MALKLFTHYCSSIWHVTKCISLLNCSSDVTTSHQSLYDRHLLSIIKFFIYQQSHRITPLANRIGSDIAITLSVLPPIRWFTTIKVSCIRTQTADRNKLQFSGWTHYYGTPLTTLHRTPITSWSLHCSGNFCVFTDRPLIWLRSN